MTHCDGKNFLELGSFVQSYLSAFCDFGEIEDGRDDEDENLCWIFSGDEASVIGSYQREPNSASFEGTFYLEISVNARGSVIDGCVKGLATALAEKIPNARIFTIKKYYEAWSKARAAPYNYLIEFPILNDAAIQRLKIRHISTGNLKSSRAGESDF